jgi:putative hydrolase of the HAD superfamily
VRFSGICLDLDDTLVDREAAFARALEALARRFPGVLGRDGVAELRALDARGRSDRAELCARVTGRFPALGPPEAFWNLLQIAIVEEVRPRPEVTAAVAALAERHRLAIVSNGGPRQRDKLSRAGLERFFPAGHVLISGELGVEKPDPRIFALALAALGLAATEVLHVGDDPARDIAGACRAGLPSCWISHGEVYPESWPPPSLALAELTELPARLEEPW